MHQLRRLKDLADYQLQAHDGEIGKLKEIYFEDQNWQVRYFVIRTGNWLFGREVLIVPEHIKKVSEADQQLRIDLTQKQIEESPPTGTEKPVSRHYEEQYYQYFNLEPYWPYEPLPGTIPPPPPVAQEPPSPPEQPHLRSSDEVSGYQIHAEGGEVGQLKTFILDDQDWTIRYLEVDTGHWLPGKTVLFSPGWIHQIDWSLREIRVDLPKDLIKRAPEYDPSKVISRDYEIKLYSHYGKAQNWR